MLMRELRAELAIYAKKMYDSRLVQATQGNLSVRDQMTGLICITPSGVDYQIMAAEDMVVMDEDGAVIEGKWQPTTETPLHLLILRRRRDIHSVMHTHSPYATAFGVAYQTIPVILADSALCLGEEIPIAPYQRSGTAEFAELIDRVLGTGRAVVWGNHGVMVVGTNLAQAFSAAHALEDNAKVYLLAKQLGIPQPLPPEEVKKLHTWWNEMYNPKVLLQKVDL